VNELHLLAMSYVFFLALIGGEILISFARKDGGYRVTEAVVNIGHGVVYQVWDSFTKVLVMVPFLWVAANIPWRTLPFDAPWAWLVGLLAYDCVSYWAHRHHHEINLLWAIHGNHHAAEDFNLAAGLRQAMLQHAFRWLWKLPLALLMPVEMYIGLVVFDYLYQFLQHTRYVPKLGPIGWVFNTPSHHRVHHGRQEKYLDRNYGGILIIWDRLFGTFQAEEEAPDYGLTRPLNTLNAVWANFAIYAQLVAATGRASGLDKARVWLGSPAELHRLAPGGPSSSPAAVNTAVNTAVNVTNDALPLRLRLYIIGSGLLVPPLLGWLLVAGAGWSLGARVGLAALILLSVVCAGGLLERKRWAVWLEALRWLAGAAGFSIAAGTALPMLMAPLGLFGLFGLGAAAQVRITPAPAASAAPRQ